MLDIFNKDKKQNIFDYTANQFSSLSSNIPTNTPSNQFQAPTQYMTPIDPTKQVSQNTQKNIDFWQFGYQIGSTIDKPSLIEYGKNIFETPEVQKEIQQRLKNPYDKLSRAAETIKFEQQAEYQKAMIWWIDDLVSWMPEDQFWSYFPEIMEKDKWLILWLAADLKAWMPATEIKKYYPEVSSVISNYLQDRYGKTFWQAIWLDKARERIRENWSWWPLWPIIQWAADFAFWLPKAWERVWAGIANIAKNLWWEPVTKWLASSTLDVAWWSVSAAFTTMFPWATAVFNVAANTPWVSKITDLMWYALEWVWKWLSYFPWLSQFKDSLANEQEKAEFDWLLGNALLLWVAKWRWVTEWKIWDINMAINKWINPILWPLNNLVKWFQEKYKTTYNAQPEVWSASYRFDLFKKYAKSKWYDLESNWSNYQQFNKVFKWEW